MRINIHAAQPVWMIPALSLGFVAAYAVNIHPSVAIILILWVAILAILTFSERSLLVMFFALLPFLNLIKRLIYFDATADTTETYLVLASQDLFLGVIAFKALAMGIREKIWRTFSPVDVAVCTFCAYSIFSILLLSPAAPLTAQLAAIESLILPMIMYFLAGQYLNHSRDLLALSKVLIITALVVALYGIYQFIGGLSSFEQAWYDNLNTASSNVAHMQQDLKIYGIFRTFSSMDSHGTYGIFLGIGLMMAWSRRFRFGTLLWLIFSVILIFALILSFTRYTWVMPGVAVCFVLFFQSRKIMGRLANWNLRRTSGLLLVVLVGSFFFLTIILSSLYRVDLFSTSNPYLRRALQTNTLYARIKWQDLLSVQDTSLLGNGLATGGGIADKFGFESADVNYHNIFIDMVDSLGMTGLILFLWLLYLFFKEALAVIQSQADVLARRLLATLFALILAMIWVGHFNGAVFYHGRAIPYFFWAFCGILAHFETRMEKVACNNQMTTP